MSVLQRLREKFWFIPAVLSVAAFVLAEALVALDRLVGDIGTSGFLGALVYEAGASGSRDVLRVSDGLCKEVASSLSRFRLGLE